MSKIVWIINEYAGAPEYGMGLRHYYLARQLVNKGFKVYIFTASYSHLLRNPKKSKDIYQIEDIDGIKYVWIKTIKYKNGNDKKRVIKWLEFSSKLKIFPYSKIGKSIHKPDFVVASTPEIFHLVPSIQLARRFKAKFIYEVRDIWPLSLVEIGNIPQNHPIIRLMKKIEIRAYKKADLVISLLPNFEKYLEDENINVKKLEIIPNGICIEELQNIENLPQNIEKLIPKNKFIVAYAGTFGEANALEYFIKAANLLKYIKDIYFILIGKGEKEHELKNLVRNLGLKNILFIPPISKKEVISVLKKYADVCYIGWRKRKLYKYGISANKIFDYLYVGKPILHSFSGGKEVDIIQQANCGVSVEAENPKAIADSIIEFYTMSKKERQILGLNGRNYLFKYYTYDKLTKKFIGALNEISI